MVLPLYKMGPCGRLVTCSVVEQVPIMFQGSGLIPSLHIEKIFEISLSLYHLSTPLNKLVNKIYHNYLYTHIHGVYINISVYVLVVIQDFLIHNT